MSKGSAFTWYDQRPLRERLMLLACLLVVMIFLCDQMIWSPLEKQRKELSAQSDQLSLQLSGLADRERIALAQKDYDPNRENRDRLRVLQAERIKQQQLLEKKILTLISPQEMPELLKALLERQKGLQLQHLANHPAEVLQINDSETQELSLTKIYRHPLQIEFSGEYLTILGYLRQLSQLPRAMVWDGVSIETLEYPQAKVRLDLHTLSLNKGWIGG